MIDLDFGLICVNPLSAGGPLNQLLKRARNEERAPFSAPDFLRLARDLMSGLAYIHSEQHEEYIVIHRDLKPDNLAFTTSGTLKLIDFGLAAIVRREDCDAFGTYHLTGAQMSLSLFKLITPRLLVRTRQGTTGSMRYLAPEVAKNLPYNEKVLLTLLIVDLPHIFATFDRRLTYIARG